MQRYETQVNEENTHVQHLEKKNWREIKPGKKNERHIHQFEKMDVAY